MLLAMTMQIALRRALLTLRLWWVHSITTNEAENKVSRLAHFDFPKRPKNASNVGAPNPANVNVMICGGGVHYIRDFRSKQKVPTR